MTTRPAIREDLPVILEIMNDAILHTTSVYDYAPRTIEFVEKWFEQKKQEGLPVLVIGEPGRVEGYGSYGIFRAWTAYRFSVEHSIYIHKNYRGGGLGKKLLADLIETARGAGYHTMIAGVDAANKKSIDFHRNAGFEEVGRFREVGYKFNRWLDLVFLQLML
jgi:L-amino acid N-acyltransferase